MRLLAALVVVSAAASLLAHQSLAAGEVPSLVGEFKFSSPGFAFYSTARDSMLITSFGALGSGSVSLFPHFSDTWKSNLSNALPSAVATGLVWPNIPTQVPEGMFPPPASSSASSSSSSSGGAASEPGIVLVGDGFLVPGKQTGNIALIDFSNVSAWRYLAPTDPNYFYHKAMPFDVDGDGNVDIVTARATLPFLGTGSGQLLWLQNPGPNAAENATWAPHVITAGPDIIFDIHPGSTPELLVVVAAEFFNKQLSLTTVSNGKLVKYAVLESSLGALDDVSFVYLDGTNYPNILLTNHVSEHNQSGLFAFTCGAASKSVDCGVWNMTVISQGFTTRAWFQGMSPGFAYALYPKVSNGSSASRQGEYPYIVLCGDGTYEVYLFSPTSVPLQYERKTLLVANGTVAALASGDFDQDGWTDFIVPNYDLSTVYGFTFKAV